MSVPDVHPGLIEVDGLVKRFGDFVAVDHVTFRVEPGEIFGFLGPNGAGKSTTIRILLGLLEPTAGRVMAAGFDVTKNPEAVRKRLGYVSQKFTLYDDLTVSENVSFFAGIYGVPHDIRAERKEAAIRMAGLEDQRNRMTGVLPLGWKQRLALACAILHQPPILFLDEPTSSVDPIARREFWEVIYQLSEAGQTVFVTTHYMDEAEYCHRVGLMYAGRLIALGTPLELKRDLYPYRLVRLEAADLLEASHMLQGHPGIRDVSMFGSGLHVTMDQPGIPDDDLRALLHSKGQDVQHLEPVLPTMEDLFVSLIHAEESKKSGNTVSYSV